MARQLNTEDVARAIAGALEDSHKCPVEVYTQIEPDEEGNAVFTVLVQEDNARFFEVKVKFLQEA